MPIQCFSMIFFLCLVKEVMTEGDREGFGERGEVSQQLEEERLLSVLTHGSTGRNPTFFKAAGHEDVFGLKADIPAGGQGRRVGTCAQSIMRETFVWGIAGYDMNKRTHTMIRTMPTSNLTYIDLHELVMNSIY